MGGGHSRGYLISFWSGFTKLRHSSWSRTSPHPPLGFCCECLTWSSVTTSLSGNINCCFVFTIRFTLFNVSWELQLFVWCRPLKRANRVVKLYYDKSQYLSKQTLNHFNKWVNEGRLIVYTIFLADYHDILMTILHILSHFMARAPFVCYVQT